MSDVDSYASIVAVAMDFDGVLTDGAFWWGPDGAEWKRLCFADVMGVSRGMKQGMQFTIISGEDSPLVDRYAAKMKIGRVYKGCKDKASALRDFSTVTGLSLEQIAYIGDDINDLEAMRIAGLSVAPADAHIAVRAHVMRVTNNGGGAGAVRELIDDLLAGREIGQPLP